MVLEEDQAACSQYIEEIIRFVTGSLGLGVVIDLCA
jgi:hypothetical protein